MKRAPRITIVTPWLDPTPDVQRTIDSVAGQGYPGVEHVLVGPDEATGALDVRRPHLRTIPFPADRLGPALNAGLGAGEGEVWAILGPGEALVPGALERVAAEIDPADGRHVVMGRCALIDDDGRPTGLEQASRFAGHRRVLEAWKGETIPRPALFWSSAAWQSCGPFEDAIPPDGIDLDLCCRLSARYPFHEVDQVLAARSLAAVAAERAEAAPLER